MPPVAVAVAGIGSSLAAGAAAVGTAASAGMAAVGGLSGLATGLSVASGAIGLVGMATGSKTLQNIGMIGGMVGGLGQGASMLAGGGAAAAGGSAASGATKAASEGFKAFPSAAGAGSSMSNIGGMAEIGKSAAGVLPNATQTGSTNVIQRMNEMLTRYDTTANVLSGMGQGYVMHKSNQLQEEQLGLQKDKFGFEKDQYNTQQANRAAVPTLPSSFGSGIKRADGSPLLNMGAR